MQPRTLDQILSQIAAPYDAQVNSYQSQMGAIPQQISDQETALGAKKDSAFEDIISGARRRGVGFSGIPLGEQAKYTATDYLPALANLRTAGQQHATTLQDAINQINTQRTTLAQQLYGQDQDRYATQQAAAAQNAGLANLFGGNAGTTPTGASQPAIPDTDRAYLEVKDFLGQGRNAAISDYGATLKSAQRGNAYDKLKIAAYQRAGINQQTLAQFYAQNAGGGNPSIDWGSAAGSTPSTFLNKLFGAWG